MMEYLIVGEIIVLFQLFLMPDGDEDTVRRYKMWQCVTACVVMAIGWPVTLGAIIANKSKLVK